MEKAGEVLSPAQVDLMVRIRQVDVSGQTRREALRTACWLGLAGFAYLSIKEIAGKETIANVLIELFVRTPEAGVSVLWVAATALMFVWATGERWVRLRKVRAMSGRIKELEKTLDPTRTSSGLTASGETPSS